MCLSRNTKVLDSFPPQKCEFNACSMWSGYSSVCVHWNSALLTWMAQVASSPDKAKEILITYDCLHL